MTHRFTGWHMLASMTAFFAVVIGVNLVMAVQATRTFGGTVVENSYVASQHFNRWLGEVRAQDALGWKLDANAPSGRPMLALTQHGAPIVAARVAGYAEHPLGRLDDIQLEFREDRPGHYVAQTPLPGGRWRLHLHVAQTAGQADFLVEVHA